MYHALWLYIVLSALLVSAGKPSIRRNKWYHSRAPSPFVSSSGGQFQLNGSTFKFVGTNAYWLQALNTEADIQKTLSDIAATGIKVVRTWAFNDVETIPENGTWFQLISNGTTAINTGPNGLQKLDQIIQHAEQLGLYVLLSLTNNWNPRPLLDNLTNSVNAVGRRDVTPGTNNSLPRNTLSNDYGGMDVYLRQAGGNRTHDEFYTDPTFINAFENYLSQVVPRYVNSPALFGWEIANDPRCGSSIPSSSTCTPQTITRWHSIIAQFIKSLDPNHLVASGNQGFFCVDCPKLFPRVIPPPPQVSPAPGSRRRALPSPLTKARLLRERIEARKEARILREESSQGSEDGVRIRGHWVSTPTKRQDNTVGAAFDGSQGVDSEDILNIPEIGFGSAQLFPDQNVYDPAQLQPSFENTVQTGIDWITRQAETGQAFGKPMALVGFGLVTQLNAPFFVPFNTSVAPFGPEQVNPSGSTSQQPYGVSDQNRDDAYEQWLHAGLTSGLQGMVQYQWAQGDLQTQPGTTISPATTGNTQSPNQAETGVSPNDGYSIAGVGQANAQNVLQQAVQNLALNV